MITEDSPDFVSSFARGLTVIRAFNAESPRQTLTEVAERAGMTRAAARRFLLTLCALGYARSDGKYFELSTTVLELGYAYLSSQGFADRIQPYLISVTKQLDESSSAAVLDGTDVVYVARSAAPHRIMTVSLGVGARLPAHCTSMGQVLLAHLEDEARDAFLATAPFQTYTQHTITSAEDLQTRLNDVREQGWAMADQELELGLLSISVPLRDKKNNVVAAMNVATHAGRVPSKTIIDHHLPILKAEAASYAETQRLYVE